MKMPTNKLQTPYSRKTNFLIKNFLLDLEDISREITQEEQKVSKKKGENVESII
ncbi:MAG: hypothetical protein WC988_02360 [Patescibacteria group bacterium]